MRRPPSCGTVSCAKVSGGRGPSPREPGLEPGTSQLQYIYFNIVLSKRDRLHILKNFYYRDIPINSLSLRVLVVFYPLPHRSLLSTLCHDTGHQPLLGALSSAALDAAAVCCGRHHPTPALQQLRPGFIKKPGGPSPTVTHRAEAGVWEHREEDCNLRLHPNDLSIERPERWRKFLRPLSRGPLGGGRSLTSPGDAP